MSFVGSATGAEHAFGVTLNHYRLADGTGYRAPSGAIHLPASISSRVTTVDGLSTLPLMQPAGINVTHKKRRTHQARISPGPPCVNAQNAETATSLEPADVAGANGYDSQPLLTANDDGTGESVALVEFSNYINSDQSSYQACYATTVPVGRVKVNGGTSVINASDEVALDQEILAAQAPGLDKIWTYVAKPSGSMASVLDRILATRRTNGIHIVSDSWGNCEAALLEADQAATNRELQLMAVAGMSFYAASGDDGSSDCHRFGINALEVDDPAVQPYATGVGGTRLSVNGSHTERAWGHSNGGGGGGVSLSFTKPSWQKGLGVIRPGLSSKTKCGGKTLYCREVPDVSFNADPVSGYVINCSLCGGWAIVGGTSAAAPLMAAFTADANEFSRTHGGVRMGFANPFLYHEYAVDRSMFFDVQTGNNSILSGHTTYQAVPNYDMATGLGSIDVNEMAQDLAAHTRSAVNIQLTKITASASRNPVTAGHPTILSGKLVDTTTHKALANRVVWIEGFIAGVQSPVFIRRHTGLHGAWSFRITRKQLPHRFQWHAVYVGEQGHRPAVSPVRTLRVG